MTLEEYLTNIAIPFRTFIANHGDPDEYPGGWVSVAADVICHTNGCIADGRTTRIIMAENYNGNYNVSCGGCEQEITDVAFWGYNGEAFTT